MQKNKIFSLFEKTRLRSLKISDNLLSQSNQSVLILITLTRYFLKLFKLIDELKNTTNKFQLAGKIGVNPYFIDEYIGSLRKYTPIEIEHNLSILSLADEELKSSTVNHKLLIQRTLTNIINHK